MRAFFCCYYDYYYVFLFEEKWNLGGRECTHSTVGARLLALEILKPLNEKGGIATAEDDEWTGECVLCVVERRDKNITCGAPKWPKPFEERIQTHTKNNIYMKFSVVVFSFEAKIDTACGGEPNGFEFSAHCNCRSAFVVCLSRRFLGHLRIRCTYYFRLASVSTLFFEFICFQAHAAYFSEATCRCCSLLCHF